MEQARLGRLLASVGAGLIVVAAVAFAVSTLAVSRGVVVDAAPDLLQVEALREPVVAELAAALPEALPPGALSPDVARVVAERMTRDAALIDDVARASAAAHSQWRDGEVPRLRLDPRVTTPAAVAALRDVDLSLARQMPTAAAVAPEPVALPLSPTSSTTVTSLRSLSLLGMALGALIVLSAFSLGVRLDAVVGRLAVAAGSLSVAGFLLIVAAAVVDPPDPGWVLASFDALVQAARFPLLVAVVLVGLLGAFLWAVSGEVAPLLRRRERRRSRVAAGLLPVPSGAGTARWRGRRVREQAIDAFFEREEREAEEHGTAGPDEDPTTVRAVITMSDRPRVAYDDHGFERAIEAVERDPRGGVGPDDDEDAGDLDVGDDAAGTRRAEAAADRREALERISGTRDRLRTHLPR